MKPSTCIQCGINLNPLLLALLLQQAAQWLQEVEDLMLNSWLLDDGMLIMARLELQQAWNILVAEGLLLYMGKSLVSWAGRATGEYPLERGATGLGEDVRGFKL